MRLDRLSLADFRNLGSVTLDFGERFTVLWGHNGAGKTNILEAIYLVSTLRSFRTTDLGALLRRGHHHGRVEIQAFDDATRVSTKLEVRIDRGARSVRRTARLDGKLIRSGADFYGRIPAVLFTPEDLAVLRGGPSGRRQFVDRVLFARESRHIVDVHTYDKLVRSRNRVLKSELDPSDRERMLDTYDVPLAEVGGRIWTRRTKLLVGLRESFAEAFARIHDREAEVTVLAAGLRYASRLDPSERVPAAERGAALAAGLAEHRRRDVAAGRTTVGPHLDDLEVTLDGSPAGEFASQGQTRALVLAFKIAELRAAREHSGMPPLLLLDDVSSELDPERTARLFDVLAAEVGQCVLTTTMPGYLDLGPVARREIEVNEGRCARAD